MMRSCDAPAVERLGLEDVAEEEDALAGESRAMSVPESGSCSQIPRLEKGGSDKAGESQSQTEADFIHLNFRKQSSYRKAIARSGLRQLPCDPSTSSLGRMEPEPYLRSTVDWTEAAVYGEHVWFETNVSGDYCYLGEQECLAKAQQKSSTRRKCAACKIVAHTVCIEQLEKFPSSRAMLLDSMLPLNDPTFRINFRCKPSFREGGPRNNREPLVVRHHWVHRRRQEGKCKQCGKGFQQKFTFHSKDIVAISCSWCKQAYHNKVSCFMLQHIEEPCPIGAHAALIVPPTWIVHVRRHQSSVKSSKKNKRASFKRKSSKKAWETHLH